MLISSPQEMFTLGKTLARKTKTLLLYGDLGAGKTTLIKGFAEGVGIVPDMVQSPTYTYMNTYQDKLLHIDMYRLSSAEELIEKGILNQISEYERVAIEWPKWIEKLDLENPLIVQISQFSPEKREVMIQ